MENEHPVTLNKEVPDITEEEIWYFIGQHQDYYMPKWSIRRPDRHASWNWPAFLFGIYWFGYRKMYRMILYALGLLTGFYILEELLNIKIYFLLMLIMWVIFGLYGNSIYYRYMKRKITDVKANMPYNATYNNRIAEAGGTSGAGIAIALLMNIAYFLILGFL